MCPLPGTGDFDYGHTVDADTIRISTIVQAGNDIDETGVRTLLLLNFVISFEFSK